MYFCELNKREAQEIAPGIRIRTFWQKRCLSPSWIWMHILTFRYTVMNMNNAAPSYQVK